MCELARRGRLLVAEPFFEPGLAIAVDPRGAGAAKAGDLVTVDVGRRGRARIMANLGPSARIECVLDGLLHRHGARSSGGRSAAALRESEQLEGGPTAADAARVDLRDLPTFTIDPDTARDFDDAISIAREGDGLRVWVHIADVTSFVAPSTALDGDAERRGLSVYVPGTVEAMLPERLSGDLCSLVPLEDRRCVTVEIPFGPGLDAGEAVFYRSLIRSDARLTYSGAEAALAGRERLEGDVGEALALAQRLSAELRRRRFERGSLRIETRELEFAFDGEGGVESAHLVAEPVAHALVEELMILANEAVASLLAERRRETIYRVHERPDPQSVTLLVDKLVSLEVPTPPVPEHLSAGGAAELAARVAESVAAYTGSSKRGREAFPSLVLRSLKQARYDPRNLGHSGLASRAYCHFTSPIRRYPDVVCHRALLREIGAADDPLPADLAATAEWCSVREREAATIERAADDVCLAWLLERRLFELGWDATLDGEIVGLIGSGLFVRFDEVFEGYLPVRRLGGDYYEVDPLGAALVGRRSGRRFRLGDAIQVTVERIDRPAGKVELAPV